MLPREHSWGYYVNAETQRQARRKENSNILCVLAFFFGLSRRVFFPFEERHALWIYSE